jgi:uncharacterized protein YyaL (SSP411 family)
VPLPSADAAAAWFVAAAKTALDRGERLDASAVSLFIALSPDAAYADIAIAQLDPDSHSGSLVALARHTLDVLRSDRGPLDHAAAREAVTALEEEVLRRYAPGRGLGTFEDDAAVASAMLRAFDAGHDPAHLMMAEELALTALRQYDLDAGLPALAAASEVAVVLWHLAEPAEKPEYRDRARQTLADLAPTYQQHGWRAAPYVSALHAIR